MRTGIADKHIATAMDMTPAQLRRTFPTELQASTEANAAVADALYEAATNGSVPAMKLWLESRAGWVNKANEQSVASLAQPLMIRLADDPTPDTTTTH